MDTIHNTLNNTLNDIPTDDFNVEIIDETEVIAEPLDIMELELAGTPKQRFNKYRQLLRIMDTVHNDIADEINKKRDADFRAFFRPEDLYIPESKNNNHYDLMMQAISMPEMA